MLAREKSGYGFAVCAQATYTLPAESSAAASNDADTTLSPASAASTSLHDPALPTCEVRVPNTAYRRPVRLFTSSAEGAPESAHWRSRYAAEPGGAIGTGGAKVAPPSVEVDTNISCSTPPDARLWNRR